uniref:Uncharacterized protein n=1 Tax=Anguilla anguilla TaxID=7936 RepID=A0A0E9T480_ANGAN
MSKGNGLISCHTVCAELELALMSATINSQALTLCVCVCASMRACV